jgi:hypothetical protein
MSQLTKLCTFKFALEGQVNLPINLFLNYIKLQSVIGKEIFYSLLDSFQSYGLIQTTLIYRRTNILL